MSQSVVGFGDATCFVNEIIIWATIQEKAVAVY